MHDTIGPGSRVFVSRRTMPGRMFPRDIRGATGTVRETSVQLTLNGPPETWCLVELDPPREWLGHLPLAILDAGVDNARGRE